MKKGMRIQNLAKICLLYLSNNRLVSKMNGRKTASVGDYVEQ